MVMKERLKTLLPYANVTKSWLANLSVASFAVGIYEQKIVGLICGVVFIALAWLLVYFEGDKR